MGAASATSFGDARATDALGAAGVGRNDSPREETRRIVDDAAPAARRAFDTFLTGERPRVSGVVAGLACLFRPKRRVDRYGEDGPGTASFTLTGIASTGVADATGGNSGGGCGVAALLAMLLSI